MKDEFFNALIRRAKHPATCWRYSSERHQKRGTSKSIGFTSRGENGVLESAQEFLLRRKRMWAKNKRRRRSCRIGNGVCLGVGEICRKAGGRETRVFTGKCLSRVPIRHRRAQEDERGIQETESRQSWKVRSWKSGNRRKRHQRD